MFVHYPTLEYALLKREGAVLSYSNWESAHNIASYRIQPLCLINFLLQTKNISPEGYG